MVKRQYESPRRAEQAQRTRSAVVAGAHLLFVANGYASTSIREIAAEARVSEQTVYRLFSDKPALLREVVLTAVGGPEDPTVARQSRMMDQLSELDSPVERLAAVAEWVGESYGRGLAELEHVVWAAAPTDDRVAELAEFMATQRYEDTRSLVLAVFGSSLKAEGVSVDDVIDYIYAVESSPVFRVLVTERGWTTEKYVQWFVRLVQRMFLESDRNVENENR